MPTDKEIEAAADAYLRVGSGGLRADFGGRDITIPFAYMSAKAALEDAEKVREREAVIQANLALEEVLEAMQEGNISRELLKTVVKILEYATPPKKED